MELSQLLSGLGTFSGAVSGFSGQQSNSAGNISLPSSSSAPSGGAAGGVVNAVGSFASGNILGGAVQLISSIGSLFGGHGVPDHERPDLNRIAADNDITADQASWVCGYEESHSPRNYDAIVSQAASDRGYFQQLVAKYNASGTSTPVYPRAQQAGEQFAKLKQQTALMFSGSPASNPLANLSLQGAQQAAAGQSMSLEDYLKALLNGALTGAQAGAAGAAADTPAGEAATWSTIKAQAKKYELVLVGAGLGLCALVYKAFPNLFGGK